MTDYREIFQPVFDKLNFTLTKTFREGPRFYVLGGDYRPPRASLATGGGEKVIFKADLAAAAERLPKARLRLRREAVFLRHAKLRYAPKFYAKGIKEGFFWLLEEWVKGESQELGESPFLIKDSFFTEQNLKHSLEFLASLHRLSEKPQPQFEKYFSRYSLTDYISLMQTDKAGVLGKILSAKADGFTRKRHRLFNQNQIVITHHEFYGSHIFVSAKGRSSLGRGEGEMQVIDWENVGWGNPAHDFVELWVRSFRNKDFQSEFFERFWASQKDKEVFDQLFRLEMILQGIGNLNHFKITKVPEEKKVAEEVSSLLLENIERALC